MSQSTNNQSQKSAHPFPPGVARTASRHSASSPVRLLATPFINRQHGSARGSGGALPSEMGNLVSHAHTRTDGRYGGYFCRFFVDLPVNSGRFRLAHSFRTIGLSGRANARRATNNHSADHAFNHLIQPLPSHSRTSVSVAYQLSDGAKGSVPNQPGEIPKQQGERRHVASV